MDLEAFFGIVSTIDFALLGLWWVTVQSRPELRDRNGHGARMAYLVSLQFVLPGTATLLAQVAPQVTAVWRVSFALAGLTGILTNLILAPALAKAGGRTVANLLLYPTTILNVLIVLLALFSGVIPNTAQFTSLTAEGIIFCALTLVGSQVAWVAAMYPLRLTQDSQPGRF